jgi:hypothetical protein
VFRSIPRSQRDYVAGSGADEQAGEVHNGHTRGQPAHDGGIEQTACVIAKRRRDLGDDLDDRANADAEQQGGQCGVVDGCADDRAEDRWRSSDGAEADQRTY